MTGAFRPCAVVPSFNHWRSAGLVVQRLRAAGLTVFIIDDGSAEPARGALAALAGEGCILHRNAVNQGKGGAVIQGLRLAIAAGYSHAVQVDADGQHDLDALPQLLALAERLPQALVTGAPLYDASVPRGRAIGRKITHFWVGIETLSWPAPDTMCGFRVYPLGAVAALLDSGERIGRRMDFDIEVVVRLSWRGTPVVELPVRVVYPPDNTSNFRMLRDNVRISLMHTRLVFIMLWRLPSILRYRSRRREASRPWPKLAERGAYAGLRICATVYRLLGRRCCMALLSPVALYFYLTGRHQRRASKAFLARAFATKGGRPPGFGSGYRHFRSFAGRALDTFIGWTGGLSPDALVRDQGQVWKSLEGSPRGCLLIVAHVGNVEMTRALLDEQTRQRLVILVHTKHAENFNRLLRKFRPAAAINCFQVTELGPETAIALRERIDRGDWVVIAGDRPPVGSQGRTSMAPFLGRPAPFSQGPYILGALLECPVYTLFCLREGRQHRVELQLLAEHIVLPRRDRAAALQSYATAFARRLEGYALRDPYQWYNFFDFWAQPVDEDGR